MSEVASNSGGDVALDNRQKMSCVRKSQSASQRWCSAVNCHNHSGKTDEKLSFFLFPKDEERCRKWAFACRRADFVDKPAQYLSKNCRLCSKHFESKMFLNDLRNRLHTHAVPTIFECYATHKNSLKPSLDEGKEMPRPKVPPPVINCSAQFCKSTSVAIKGTNIKLFSFPVDPERCGEWIRECGLEDKLKDKDTIYVSRFHKLCSRHFENSMFHPGANLLLESAVPTMFDEEEDERKLDNENVSVETKVSFVLTGKINGDKSQSATASKKHSWCAAASCKNNSSNKPDKNFSYFRFPKDQERSIQWVMACRRRDLMDKDADYLYNNCKLCSNHFEDIMFLNDLRNRLHSHAIPTLFPSSSLAKRTLAAVNPMKQSEKSLARTNKRKLNEEDLRNSSVGNQSPDGETRHTTDHTYDKYQNVEDEAGLKVSGDPQLGSILYSMLSDNCGAENQSETHKPKRRLAPPPQVMPKVPTCSVPKTPRELLLMKNLRKHKSRYLRVKERVARTTRKAEEIDNQFETFKKTFVKYPEQVKSFVQMFLPCHQGKGTRYSEGMKKFAMTVYSLSPRAYAFLATSYLPLPSTALLRRMRANGDVSLSDDNYDE